MITAYAVTTAGDGMPALLRDRARADDYAAACHGIVHKLVDEAAILRKFDGYVPADQASSMRWRILELEEVVRSEVAARAPLLERIRELEARAAASAPAANAAACRSPAQDVMRCPNAACGWLGECIENPPVEVVTDPAAITAAFAADDDEWRRIDDLAAWASRCAQDEIDGQCDTWAGLPIVGAGLLS